MHPSATVKASPLPPRFLLPPIRHSFSSQPALRPFPDAPQHLLISIGMLKDIDGSLTKDFGSGVPGGYVVPPTGQWRTNSNCTQEVGGHYTMCGVAVHRVSVTVDHFTSPWWDTNIKKLYPLLVATDITEEDVFGDSIHGQGWDLWNREQDESAGDSYLTGRYHVSTPKGPNACFEQVG